MPDPTDRPGVPVEAVLTAYHRRVAAAVGSVAQASMWDAALAEADAESAHRRADELAGEVDRLAARITNVEDTTDG